MNATLSLLLPLAAGFHPGPAAAPAGCSTCAPQRPATPLTAQPWLQPPTFGQPCPPLGPPAAVLTTTILAPEGVKVTFSPGTAPRTFAAPATAGLRPGYFYRFALTDLPNHPGETLFPVLEVVGSLVPRPTMNPADYPTPVIIRQGDIEKALTGTLVTKVIYLEDPKAASPVEVKAGDPLEYSHDVESEALQAARDNGRVVAILRLGDRKPDAMDLAAGSVPGTVLYRGDARLAAPPVPPCLPWLPVAVYDPIHGPRPLTEECFTDGGDKGSRLGIGPGGRLGGLDPTDVAVEFTQGAARRVVTSNEVCICVPRFVARRVDLGLGRLEATTPTGIASQSVVQTSAKTATPALAVTARDRLMSVAVRIALQEQVGRRWASEFNGLTQLQATGSVQGVATVASVVEVDELTNANLFAVTKTIDPPGPHHVGQEVTVTIKYRNNTRTPVTDIVVSDSLSGRLEYVPGSAAADRPANVTSTANEVGSSVVRFELPGALAPGQGGEVKFRAKIR